MVLKIKRRPRFRRKAKTTRAAKVVKAVVRRELAHNIETKARYVGMSKVNMFGGKMYLINPAYWIPNDTSLSGTVGSKLQHAKLHIKGTVKSVGVYNHITTPTEEYPWSHVYVRLVVFRHTKEFHNTFESNWSELASAVGQGTAPEPLLNTEIIRGGADSWRFHQSFQNPQECKFLFDKTMRVGFPSNHRSNNLNNTLEAFGYTAGDGTFDYTINLGTVLRQATAATGVSYTKQNIYVVAMASTPEPAPQSNDNIADLSCDYVLSWKDA